MSDNSEREIWIIEDWPTRRESHVQAFKQAGYSVREFDSVYKAFEVLGCKGPPYGVVTDNDMADGDNYPYGIHLMRALKGTRVGRVLATGMAEYAGDIKKVSGKPAELFDSSDVKEPRYLSKLVTLIHESAKAAALEVVDIKPAKGDRPYGG